MIEISMKEMLEAGVHFGHKSDRWNPKMRPFIFTERNGVHIFDLALTKEKLEEAIKVVSRFAADGGSILFVGTKNQTRDSIKAAAEKAGMPYLVERWPGGMLTNFNTILGRLKYMKDAEEKLESGKGMTKKEQLVLKRELEKLSNVFEGVKDIRRIPDVMIVADIVKEHNAVREAKRLRIPVIGIADTNAEPNIEYIIPGNDDAVRSVAYIVGKLAEAIVAVKKEIVVEAPAEKDVESTVEDDLPVEELEKIEAAAEEAVVVKKSRPKDEPKKEE